MDWGARLRAAWRGDVSNADLAAMFAATARLSDLQQALADRRLAADIEHAGHEWRALLAVGPIAGPLWLADALVTLAGALYDADAPASPGAPAAMNAYIHDIVAELLAPIEDIIADVTAALADAGHHTALTRPMRVGPGGDIAGERSPDLPPAPYVRGLAAGARRVHTAAAAALAEASAAVAKSVAPDWLASGLRRLDGEIQGASARLDMDEVRLPSLLGERGGGDSAAQADVCRDLWRVVEVAVVAGQVTADPHLLPEARTAAQHAAPEPDTAVWASPAAAPPTPPLPPRRMRRVELPQIAEGMPDAGRWPAAPLVPERSSAPPDPPLPAIGGPDVAPPPVANQPAASVLLPAIGGDAAHPPTGELPTTEPPRPHTPPTGHTGEEDAQPDEEPPYRFPTIG